MADLVALSTRPATKSAILAHRAPQQLLTILLTILTILTMLAILTILTMLTMLTILDARCEILFSAT
jgi:hypothetical protein